MPPKQPKPLSDPIKQVRRLVYACRYCNRSADMAEDIPHESTCRIYDYSMDYYTCQLCGHHGMFQSGQTEIECGGCHRTIVLFKAPKDYVPPKATD
jgi:hypothetical protein